MTSMLETWAHPRGGKGANACTYTRTPLAQEWQLFVLSSVPVGGKNNITMRGLGNYCEILSAAEGPAGYMTKKQSWETWLRKKNFQLVHNWIEFCKGLLSILKKTGTNRYQWGESGGQLWVIRWTGQHLNSSSFPIYFLLLFTWKKKQKNKLKRAPVDTYVQMCLWHLNCQYMLSTCKLLCHLKYVWENLKLGAFSIKDERKKHWVI